MREEREIDIAFALEGAPSVEGVYALDRATRTKAQEEEYELAIVLRPYRVDTISELHYRLLCVMSQAECGRVLFVNADSHPPLPMARARPLHVPESARAGAILRALSRVEDLAKRYAEEEDAVLQHGAVRPSRSDDPSRAFEDALDVAIALHGCEPVRSVRLIGYRVDDRGRIDVFVEVHPFGVDQVLAAHRRVVESGIVAARGRVLYGDGLLRACVGAPRVRVTPFDRSRAARRAELRAAWRPPDAGSPPLAARAAVATAISRTRYGPIALSTESAAVAVVAPLAQARRARVLIIDESAASAAALAPLVREVHVTHVRDGWAACDRLAEETFDLVLCAIRVGEMRGTQIRRIATQADPANGARFYLMASKAALDGAPPSAALARVISSPPDCAEVRRILAAFA